MKRARLLFGAALLFRLGVALPARADHESLAEALFRDGRKAMRADDYAHACPKLAESERLDPSAGTRLNLALCDEHELRLAAAWAHYREVIDALPETDPRVAFAAEHARALEPRVPRLRILVPADAAPRTVTLDGVALGEASLGLPLPIDPGPHALAVETAAGKTVVSISLAEGETRDEAVTLPIAAPPPRPDAQTRAHPSAQRTTGWIVGGAGAATLASSLVLGALVLHEKNVVSSDCKAQRCSGAGLAAGRDGSTFAVASTVSFGLGIAALGTGVGLALSAPSIGASRHGASFVLLQGAF